MGLVYAAGFEVGGANSLVIFVEGDDATVAPGYYMAGDVSTADVEDVDGDAWSGQAYTAFATAVQTALNATPSGPGYTVTWDDATGFYTVSYAPLAVPTNFTMDFTVSSEYIRAGAALGFGSVALTGANTYTSTTVPRYVMVSAMSGRHSVIGPIEAEDIAEESVSDGGEDFVLTRKTSELLMTWDVTHEPRSNIYIAAAAGAQSWQRWFRDIRGSHPFWVGEPLEGEPLGAFYRLTAKGASFMPTRIGADDETFWSVPFKTRWLGVYSP